eukprot:TRINITY_DN2773_c0_g1_i3.p1 TRINITY_DN2773_c0_g1~~TRINITY_DN2773_c0_g1_i3.p1  ORF type:complete len:400 (+),score=49.46 TRINITY_DN2773_c0_g1_i3:60-1202(+)
MLAPWRIPALTARDFWAVCVPRAAVPAALPAVLERCGFAVVPDACSAAEVGELQALWHADLLDAVDFQHPELSAELAARLRKSAPQDWPAVWLGAPGDPHSFARRYGVPHGRFAWRARLHPAVRGAFAALHRVAPEELCVGLDIVFWASNTSAALCAAAGAGMWPHADHNCHVECSGERATYQSVLYVHPSPGGLGDATAVWPGSHAEPYQDLMADKAHKEAAVHARHYAALSDCADPERQGWAAPRPGAERGPAAVGLAPHSPGRVGRAGGTAPRAPRYAHLLGAPQLAEPRGARSEAMGVLRRRVHLPLRGSGVGGRRQVGTPPAGPGGPAPPPPAGGAPAAAGAAQSEPQGPVGVPLPRGAGQRCRVSGGAAPLRGG